MDENNRNFILAIVLSMVVLFAWQFIFVPDTPLDPQQVAEKQAADSGAPQLGADGATPQVGGAPSVGGAPQPSAIDASAGASTGMTREQTLAASPRIAIETPSVRG